jgi:hypothetical protein
MHRDQPYTLTPLVAETAAEDRAGALAFFLLDNVGSIFGRWGGRMPKTDQLTLFGRYFGKGQIFVDGAEEDVWMTISMCFGTMRDTVASCRWAKLPAA